MYVCMYVCNVQSNLNAGIMFVINLLNVKGAMNRYASHNCSKNLKCLRKSLKVTCFHPFVHKTADKNLKLRLKPKD